MTFYENRSRYAEAIASGREGLSLFGVTFPDEDAAIQRALQAELDRIQRVLGDRTIASLAELPEMNDIEVRTSMRLLKLMWAPVYISGKQPLTSLISATMVRLSVEHGNTEDSAYGYVTHAITVGPVQRQIRAGVRVGRTGTCGERALRRYQTASKDPSTDPCPCEALAPAVCGVHSTCTRSRERWTPGG